MTRKIIKSPYFWLFLLAIVNLLIAFYFVRYPLALNGDAPSYLNAMRLIEGKDYNTTAYGEQTEKMLKTRILTTPLMLQISIWLSYLTGAEYSAILLINIWFYFLTIFVFYQLALAIYQNQRVALTASVLFFANYVFFNYGPTYRTDIAGWFFFLLAALLAVKYFKAPAKKKFYYLAIFSAAVGVLFKEYGGLGLIPLFILILFLPQNFKQKIKKLIKAAVLFSILPLFYYLFIYFKFHFSYLDRYSYAVSETVGSVTSPAIHWSLILLIKVLGWLFLAGWPIFLFGLYQEYKNFNQQRFKILLAIFPAAISFLAWPGLTQRIAFVFVPFLAMISGFGLSKIKRRYLLIAILAAYALINYLTRNLYLSWDLMKLINFSAKGGPPLAVIFFTTGYA